MIMWSTPLQIPLDSAHRTVVGRPSKTVVTTAGVHHVFLNSEKLPFMLSKQHASLAFDKGRKKWLIEDMKSENGVYVNETRIKEATTLSDTDNICFGCRVPKNELKYIFCWKYGKAWLKRNLEPFVTSQNLSSITSPKSSPAGSMRDRFDSSESDSTPPLVRTPKTTIAHYPLPRKKLRLDRNKIYDCNETYEHSATQPITDSGSSSAATYSDNSSFTTDLTPTTSSSTGSHSLSLSLVSSPLPISSPRSQVLPLTYSPPILPHYFSSTISKTKSTGKTKSFSPQAIPSSPVKQCGCVSTSHTSTFSPQTVPSLQKQSGCHSNPPTAPFFSSSPNVQAHGIHTIPVSTLEVGSHSSTTSTVHITPKVLSFSTPLTSSPLHTIPTLYTRPTLHATVAKPFQLPGSPQVNVPNNSMLSGAAVSHVNLTMGQPSPQVLLAPSSVQPSPALSVAPMNTTEVDDVFDDILSKSDDRLLDDVVITGYNSPVKQCSAPIVLSVTPIPSTKALGTNTTRVSSEKFSLHPLPSQNVTSPTPLHSTTLQMPTCGRVFPLDVTGAAGITTTTPSLPASHVAVTSSCIAEHSSPLVVLSGVKPSPALSVASTKSVEVDDLFDNIVSMSDDNLLDEAVLFGDNSVPDTLSAFTNTAMDGATIQVLAAEEKQQQEKHKLLSSIEALKSELAAKNELITKIEQDNKDEGTVCSIREEFTCVICQELFISAHTLPCAHSFCEYCIKEWTKKKCRKECPICRKRITSEPVHSLVLDNAIEKIEVKLSAEDKQERDVVKAEHKKQLGVSTASGQPSVIVVDSTSTATPTSSSESDDSDSDGPVFSFGGFGYRSYGRCFHCGERGHWRPECPYR